MYSLQIWNNALLCFRVISFFFHQPVIEVPEMLIAAKKKKEVTDASWIPFW